VARSRPRLMVRGAFFEAAGAVGFVGSEALASPTALNGLGSLPCALLLPTRLSPTPGYPTRPRTRNASPRSTCEEPAFRNPQQVSHQTSCSGASSLPPPFAGHSSHPEPLRRHGSLPWPGGARKRARSRRGGALRQRQAGGWPCSRPPHRAHAQSEQEARPWWVRSHIRPGPCAAVLPE
jgi:hypothetical protein